MYREIIFQYSRNLGKYLVKPQNIVIVEVSYTNTKTQRFVGLVKPVTALADGYVII